MTKNQKAYKQWIGDFCSLCLDLGAIPVKEGGGFDVGLWRSRFETKLGELFATIHISDYESQTKRGFVEIYLRLGQHSKAITGKVYDTLQGRDFNGYSGKWNIAVSGDKKDVFTLRQTALAELESRINYCNQCPAANP